MQLDTWKGLSRPSFVLLQPARALLDLRCPWRTSSSQLLVLLLFLCLLVLEEVAVVAMAVVVVLLRVSPRW